MREHWEKVYRDKPAEALSWNRAHLEQSLALLERAGLSPASRVIDVGGGTSTLVDDLAARRVSVTVLDLSQTALDIARARVGDAGVEWRQGDVTTIDLPAAGFTHWHDRAVLHFLTDAEDAAAYARQAAHAVKPGGYAVIAGFAPQGPERCSGLVVARRSAEEIATLLGPAFALMEHGEEVHHTPWQAPQTFVYTLLRRLPARNAALR